jgi:RNA polymerase nonessential primary-like sigma factor
MHTDARRALALMHLVREGRADRMGADAPALPDADLVQHILRDALKDSVACLLDTPAFSQGVIGADDLTWRGKSRKDADADSDETGGSSEAAEMKADATSRRLESHREDWSSVGYDPKYRNIKRLAEQDELRFVVLAKAGDRFATQKLILHHLPLLKTVARRYPNNGLDLSEMVNEGVFGLVKAIDRFETERALRFGTYAQWWIRDAIEQALLRESRLIRLPGHVVRLQNEKRRADMHWETEGGRDGAAHDEPGFIQACGAAWDENADGEAEGIDETTPETVFVDKQRIALLERGLAKLAERERQVLIRRYGLHSDVPDTLEAVALDFGISYERVRQIQKTALGKLNSFLAPHYASII